MKKIVCPTGRKQYIHETIEAKEKFDSRSFRSIKRGDHVITIGCPKGKWDNRNRRCKVGTRAQRILHPPFEARYFGCKVKKSKKR